MAVKEEIIRIKLDTDDFKKQITDRSKEIVKIKDAITDLNFEIVKNGKATEEQENQLVELESTLRLLNKEQSDQKRNLDNINKAQKANLGSNNELKATILALTQQYDDLSREERENAEIGGKLQKQIKEMSDELKGSKKAIGDTRLEVGSYSEAIEKAVSGNATLGDGLGKLKESFEQFKAIGNLLALSFKGQAAATEAATAATVEQGAATAATTNILKGAQKSAILFGGALKALGIGLVIAAIAGLVSYFNSTREGADKLGQGLAFLGGIFDELVRRSAAFGKAIFDAVTSPIEQIKKLGNFLKLVVTEPKKAFEVFKETVKGLQINLSEVAAAALKAGQAMAELKKQQQLLERDRINNIATSKELVRQEEALKNIRDNEFNSIGKRIAANEKAGKIEQERIKILAGLAQRRVDLLIKEADLRGGIAKLTNEQLQELREAELEVADLREESIGRQNELITNRYTLEQERIELLNNQLKAAIDIRVSQAERAAEKEIASLDRVRKAQLEGIGGVGEAQRKLMERQKDQLKVERDNALRVAKLSKEERLLIEEQYQQGIFQLTQEFTVKAMEEEKKRVDTILAERKKEVDLVLAVTENGYQEEQKALSEQFLEGLTTREQYNRELQDLEVRHLQQQLDDANALGLSTLDIEKQIIDKRIELRQFEYDRTREIEGQKYDLIYEGSVAVGELINYAAGQSKAAADFQKALTIFQLGLDTVRSLSQIVTLATAPSADNILSGGLAVPLKIVTLTAAVLANINKARQILSGNDTPEAPQFADGGVLKGPSHKQGGIKLQGKGAYYGEAEGDEIILTKNVYRTPALRAAASALNVAAGGRPLIPSFYNAQGGVLPSTTRAALSESGFDMDVLAGKIADSFSRMPAPIVNVNEINDRNSQIARRNVKVNT